MRLISISGQEGLPVRIRFRTEVNSEEGLPILIGTSFPAERDLYQIGMPLDARDYPAWYDEPQFGMKVVNLDSELYYVYREGDHYAEARAHQGQSFKFHLGAVELGKVYERAFTPDCREQRARPVEHFASTIPSPEKVPPAHEVCQEQHRDLIVAYQFLP